MEHSVCFIGHRKINDTSELRKRLQEILQELLNNGTKNFIFGDHSEFNDLSYELVTELKEKHPEIKRINFRLTYEDADDYTMQFLIKGYEESIFPKSVSKAGKAGYIKRNMAMIDESDVCIFYYDENYHPLNRSGCSRKSGTELSFKYALKKKKIILNIFTCSDGG